MTEISAEFTVPAGVDKISLVLIGPGGNGADGGMSGDINFGGGGGGGGALFYQDNVSVTPGSTYQITISAPGSSDAKTVFGSTEVSGGKNGDGVNGGLGGSGIRKGGNGGNGATGNFASGGGGGGACGYTNNGGNGARGVGTDVETPIAITGIVGVSAGDGGSGGGSGAVTNFGSSFSGNGGGSGVPPVLPSSVAGGRGGYVDTANLNRLIHAGNGYGSGVYGYGGAGGPFSPSYRVGSPGGLGFVGIIWGEGRTFSPYNFW